MGARFYTNTHLCSASFYGSFAQSVFGGSMPVFVRLSFADFYLWGMFAAYILNGIGK